MNKQDFTALQQKINAIANNEPLVREADRGPGSDKGEIMVGGYQTRHFDMCPGATALYKDIEPSEMAERAAKLQDVLFYLEKDPDRPHVEEDIVMAQIVADEIMNMADSMGMTDEHDYVQGHVEAIKKMADMD